MAAYAQGSIAGVSLVDGAAHFKALLVNAANARLTVVGSTIFAADGTPYTQIMEVTTGAQFGVKLEYAKTSVVEAIITAVEAAMIATGSFAVVLADDLHSINAQCVPDYAAGWYSIEPQRTNPDVIKGVEFKFLTAA